VSNIKRIFLLSHCDDEIFLLPFLLNPDAESTLIFFTTRKGFDKELDLRKSEAVLANHFLNRFQNVKTIFLTPELHDGLIHEEFNIDNFQFLEQIIVQEKPEEVVTLAFEGGHQDHDSVEVIARILCEKHRVKLVCCPAYRSAKFSRKLFTVMHSDLVSQRVRISRLRTLAVAAKIMLIYRSQIKTWVGLAPFILLKYAIFPFRVYQVNPILEVRRLDRCFYELRNRAVQSEVLSSLRGFTIFQGRSE
jgi:hypothetical protein